MSLKPTVMLILFLIIVTTLYPSNENNTAHISTGDISILIVKCKETQAKGITQHTLKDAEKLLKTIKDSGYLDAQINPKTNPKDAPVIRELRNCYANLSESVGDHYLYIDDDKALAHFNERNKYRSAMNTKQREIQHVQVINKLKTDKKDCDRRESTITQEPHNSKKQQQQIKDQSLRKTKALKDYEQLKKMYNQIKALNTEQEVVDTVLNNRYLNMSLSRTAITALEKLLHSHNRWTDTGDPQKTVNALRMIAEMQSMADNPHKQNEIYRRLLYSYRNKLAESNTHIINAIQETIDNNNRYIETFNWWRKKHSPSKNTLDDYEKKLKYHLLTLEQEIQAHYILARIYEKKSAVAKSCRHFASAYLLMKSYNIQSIILIPSFYKDTISIEHLKKKTTQLNEQLLKSEPNINEFREFYKNTYPDMSTINHHCRETPDEYLSQFLDTLHRFIKAAAIDKKWEKIFPSLLKTPLQVREFEEIKSRHGGIIPDEYDSLMNLFFYVLYQRNEGWNTTASDIVNNNDNVWNTHITNKLKEIYNEMLAIYGINSPRQDNPLPSEQHYRANMR